MRHVLLTALGTSPRTTTYSLVGQEATAEASLCPIALVELLEPAERPSHVYAIVTAAAQTGTFPTLELRLKELIPEIVVEPIPVADVSDTDAAGTLLEAIAAAMEPEDRLTLDVTHGLRHMPFLMYALSLYVTALQNVTLEGAYCGIFETPMDPKPILNLQPLLELPHWFQAVEEFQDSGNAQRMARLIRDRNGRVIPGRQYPLSLRHLADNLDKGSAALAAGLTPEAGLDAAAALRQIQNGKLNDALHDIPLAKPLADLITNHLQAIAVSAEQPVQKATLVLDERELARQLKIVAIAIRSGNVASAVGMLREWFVSWMLWRGRCDHEPAGNDWLPEPARDEMERRLGRLAQALQNQAIRGAMNEPQLRLAKIWHTCSQLRNSCMHFGMTLDEVRVKTDTLLELHGFAELLLSQEVQVPNDVALPKDRDGVEYRIDDVPAD